MPDGESVLFSSDRRGTGDIYRQHINSRIAEPVVSGPGEEHVALVSPDHQWILYGVRQDPGRVASTDPTRLKWSSTR